MVDQHAFRKIIDEDMLKLKILLKGRIASFDDIKKEEEKLIDMVKHVMAQVKEMEKVMEQEITLFRKLSGGWGKAYANKRWDLIGKAVQGELNDFHEEYLKTQDMYKGVVALHQRLETLVSLLKDMNVKNKESRQEKLKLLQDFRKQKQLLQGELP
jgi:hypothetical protein